MLDAGRRRLAAGDGRSPPRGCSVSAAAPLTAHPRGTHSPGVAECDEVRNVMALLDIRV